MSVHADDRRVQPHPDGTWMVFDDANDWAEYNVAPLRDPGTWEVIPGPFGAFDAAGGALDVPEGPFDEVVCALIGGPQ